jgi:hypothetical protein
MTVEEDIVEVRKLLVEKRWLFEEHYFPDSKGDEFKSRWCLLFADPLKLEVLTI